MSVETSRTAFSIRGSNPRLKKAVLITGIGGDIAQGVANYNGETRPDLRLIGIDIHSEHGGHLFVDAFEVVASATDPDYCKQIQAVTEKYGVEIFIPMTEPELRVLSPLIDMFPGVHFVTAARRLLPVR